MKEQKNKWQGLRAIVVARQSDDGNGTASTEAQLDHIKKKLAQVGMIFVDKKMLEDVPASAPAKITEILQDLFKRKKRFNDFDVIVWQVEDRATRGGGEFGMWLGHEAKRNGLRVYFTDSEMDERPYSPVIRTAKYEAAKEESVGKGRRCAQKMDTRPVEQVVEEAIAILADESQRLLKLTGEPLREAVNGLIPEITVDMETKEVEMLIALPAWATDAKQIARKTRKNGDKEVCPTTSSWSQGGGWTHIVMMTFTCQYRWFRGSKTQSPCYTCQRVAA